MRIDQRCGDGFARRFPAPQHELEHRIEAFALFDGGFGDGFRLFQAQPLILTCVEDGRVAEHDKARSRPHFEMAEPELLIDQSERLVDRHALFDGDLDVGESEELQDLVFRAPHAAEFILRPAAGCRSDDLPFCGAFAGPTARFEILLEHFDRGAVVALLADFFLAQDAAPGLGLAGRFAGPPAVLASSAAMRAFRISFSSRAAAAIALTASNSSRPTKSAPAIHSRIFSRADDSASRPMPAKVPARPFTILTMSSNILFSDCIG